MHFVGALRLSDLPLRGAGADDFGHSYFGV